MNQLYGSEVYLQNIEDLDGLDYNLIDSNKIKGEN